MTHPETGESGADRFWQNATISVSVVAAIILLVAIAVLLSDRTPPDPRSAEFRTYAPDAGVTCYVYRDTAISCVRAAP